MKLILFLLFLSFGAFGQAYTDSVGVDGTDNASSSSAKFIYISFQNPAPVEMYVDSIAVKFGTTSGTDSIAFLSVQHLGGFDFILIDSIRAKIYSGTQANYGTDGSVAIGNKLPRTLYFPAGAYIAYYTIDTGSVGRKIRFTNSGAYRALFNWNPGVKTQFTTTANSDIAGLDLIGFGQAVVSSEIFGIGKLSELKELKKLKGND